MLHAWHEAPPLEPTGTGVHSVIVMELNSNYGEFENVYGMDYIQMVIILTIGRVR